MAHPKHKEVRERYKQRCGYCGVEETATGGELTVDHYRPVVFGGDDTDENLVYACFRCNLYKADFFPSSVDENNQHRVLHPLLDNVSLHIKENTLSGFLDPLSETGKFHIRLLRLNRPQLVEYPLRCYMSKLLLIGAIERSTEARLLLVGEPGSGKSVSLRHSGPPNRSTMDARLRSPATPTICVIIQNRSTRLRRASLSKPNRLAAH